MAYGLPMHTHATPINEAYTTFEDSPWQDSPQAVVHVKKATLKGTLTFQMLFHVI